MANSITAVRIICSVGLLFVPVFSPAFYVLYLIAGSSDMVDGTIARKTSTVSDFGSKLDTAADIVLVAVCLLKMISVLDVPAWLIIWIAVIALIKVINIISGYAMRKEFVAAHTVVNKMTGVALFLLPLTLPIIDLEYSSMFVCALATFAALQEGRLIRTGEEKKSSPNIGGLINRQGGIVNKTFVETHEKPGCDIRVKPVEKPMDR